MLGLIPILINTVLVSLLVSWVGGAIFLVLIYYMLPGRGIKAKLDHDLRLDGQMMAGAWPLLPGSGCWRKRQVSFLTGLVLLAAWLLLPSGSLNIMHRQKNASESLLAVNSSQKAKTDLIQKINEIEASQPPDSKQNKVVNGKNDEVRQKLEDSMTSSGLSAVERKWDSTNWLNRKPGQIGY